MTLFLISQNFSEMDNLVQEHAMEMRERSYIKAKSMYFHLTYLGNLYQRF